MAYPCKGHIRVTSADYFIHYICDSNTYTYNANGIRTSKTVGGVQHTYSLDGTTILKETWGDCTLIPLYDNEDSVCGIIYDDAAYYFYKNLQGDVIAITDDAGVTVARYTYDAWGKVLSVTDANGTDIPEAETHIANINPFRYRSYYYDSETELYYLQSRYYNPEVGRFINADAVINRHRVVSDNLFVYCENDPIAYTDESGYSPSYYNAFFKALVLTNKEFKKESDYIAKSFGMFVTSKVSTFTGSSSFRKLWNKTACDYDVVVVNCHSSYNRMQYLISPNYRFKKIHAKALVLLGCNAGHYNYIWSNVAKKFSKYVSGYVMASDGTVYSSSKNPSFNPVFTSKPDKSWERYNRRNKRTTNYGWVIYQYLRGTYYWWSTNLVSASVNDMLSYLCNVGFLIFDQYYAPDIYRL